jgi:hypothetical protein
MPGGGGIGRPLGPSGGRGPGGGGTGLPEGLRGGRAGRDCSGAPGGAAVSGALAAGDWAAGDWAAGDWAAGDWAAGDWAAGDWAAGEAAGDWAAGDWARGACCAVGPFGVPSVGRVGALVGRLVMRRGPGAVGTPVLPGVDAATLRTGAAAFFAGLELVTAPALDAATVFLAPPATTGAASAGPDADFVAALLAAGSSGCTGRRSPSASALRRTRSACASSMEEEWLLTPIPRDKASSRPSLLVRPSSLASS